ncbi:TonB-dependent receptor [Flagellimonas sp. 389]|uniref:TonB-dependent receptor n=1 Tax=Flagellimonas sp. 389 TaxID=2835862 RepID=UPI001BD41149|nr:TonB-dependent receptor [Flagellimonas sp. 389]MBS9462622.1 TonB-dependent receptor [Flagellimonas sp. 389]
MSQSKLKLFWPFMVIFLVFAHYLTFASNPLPENSLKTNFQSYGTITGRVVDEAGMPLPGASVVIRNLNTGASTSLEGLFQLDRVPFGSHKLEVSYIGYEKYNITTTVDQSLQSTGNIVLKPETNQLGEVIITGSFDGQQRAFNQQKNADNIKTIVSADLIGRFPDINVGEAMQRVPGVNIERNNGEGSNVKIRGTPQNFTTISINGEQIPTTDEGGGRTESLDLISADQLASMEVSKAITPDMDGDAVGGAINLITATATSSKGRVKGSIGGGYNNLFEKASQVYRFKFDKRFANEKFGILIGSSFYNTFNGEERFEATYRDRRIGNQDDPNSFRAFVLDDYRLRPLLNERTRIGVNATFDYKFSENSSLVFKATYNNLRDKSLRRRTRFRPRNNYQDPLNPNVAGPDNDVRVRRDINDRVINRENINISLEGNHPLGDFAKLDYGINYSRNERKLNSDRFVFRERDLTLVQERDGDFTIFSSPDADFEDYSAFLFNSFQQDLPILNRGDNTVARLNLTIPFRLGKNSGEFKTGGKYRDLDNLRRRNTVEYNDFNGPYNLSQVLDGNSGTIFDGRYEMGQFPNPNSAREHFNLFRSAYDLDVNTSRINSESFFFDAGEDVYAAYFQGKIQFNNFRILAGVRYEKTDVLYEALELQIEPPAGDDQPAVPVSSEPISGGRSYDFFLPMVHLKYQLSDRTNLRFAYTQSYARPTLEDLVPSENINFADQVLTRGNPNLDPAESHNFDLLFEHYLKGAGVISGGIFYKDISTFIFQQFANVDFNNDLFLQRSPINGDEATLLGVELNFVKKMDFLPGFLSGLGVFANYTYVDSDSSFSSLNEDTGELETREGIPFIGQADHTWNAALSYDKGGFSARASLNYNGRSLTSFATTSDFDFFLEERYQLDVNASQKITDNLTFFIEFINLTNEPVVEFQTIRSQVTNYEIYDWSARFGINFKF